MENEKCLSLALTGDMLKVQTQEILAGLACFSGRLITMASEPLASPPQWRVFCPHANMPTLTAASNPITPHSPHNPPTTHSPPIHCPQDLLGHSQHLLLLPAQHAAPSHPRVGLLFPIPARSRRPPCIRRALIAPLLCRPNLSNWHCDPSGQGLLQVQ